MAPNTTSIAYAALGANDTRRYPVAVRLLQYTACRGVFFSGFLLYGTPGTGPLSHLGITAATLWAAVRADRALRGCVRVTPYRRGAELTAIGCLAVIAVVPASLALSRTLSENEPLTHYLQGLAGTALLGLAALAWRHVPLYRDLAAWAHIAGGPVLARHLATLGVLRFGFELAWFGSAGAAFLSDFLGNANRGTNPVICTAILLTLIAPLIWLWTLTLHNGLVTRLRPTAKPGLLNAPPASPSAD